MANSLWSRSVKLSPAAAGFSGRVPPIHGGSHCRFDSKPPPANASFRASSPKVPPLPCSAPSSTVATANRPLPPPSPPSDLATSPVPLLLIPPILVNKDEYQVGENEEEDPYIFYSPSKKEIVTVEKNRSSWRREEIRDAYWVGSSKGWVMFMNRNDCNLYLCNPFSPSTSPIIPLPPIETLPCVVSRHFRRRRLYPDEPEPTSHEMDFEFVMEDWYNTKDPDGPFFEGNWYWERAKAYREEKTKKKWFEAPLPSPFEPNIVPSKDLIEQGFTYKMALSCSPPSPSNNYTNECMVAIIYGFKALAICRLGDSCWTRVDGMFSSEMSFSRHDNSCLYTWDYDNYEFKSCNLSNPKSPEWNSFISLDSSRIVLEYMVESEPGNLLVVGNSDGNKVMEVYKVDTAKKTREKLKSLNGQALFVGAFSETMLVPATELPPLVKPNCIYFTNFNYFHMGLFDLEKRVVNYQFEGLDLDLSLGKECHDYYERPEFRKKGEGWPVWVKPNPW